MLDAEQLDCVDIATHDVTHTALVEAGGRAGGCTSSARSRSPRRWPRPARWSSSARAGVRFMVMEMWRHLQAGPRHEALPGPGHHRAGPRAAAARAPPRELRRTRPIDDEQPYLADLPKLMVYDTYIHHIDGIRYLLGDVTSVYARMARDQPGHRRRGPDRRWCSGHAERRHLADRRLVGRAQSSGRRSCTWATS